MREVDKQIKVIVVTGDEQEATAQRIDEQHTVTVLTPHDVGEAYEKSADTVAENRDVNSTTEAELGTENFVLQVVTQLPASSVAVLYDLSSADIELLSEQFGADFLQVEGESADQQVADFLAA